MGHRRSWKRAVQCPLGGAPRIHLRPEFHSVMGEIGENCSASQLCHVIGPWAVLFAPLLYWAQSPRLGLYYVWPGTRFLAFLQGLGHRSWKLLAELGSDPRALTNGFCCTVASAERSAAASCPGVCGDAHWALSRGK